MTESNIEDNLSDIKIKLLVKNLNALKGDGTSMISLLISTKGQLPKVNQMLTDEFGTATNIKSRVNRQSVLTAITAAQQKLKLYKFTPENGLAIFCGTAIILDGKEKKISIAFEPPKPLVTNLYMCDDHFHTQALMDMTKKEQTFGFIIVDGNGVQYATLSGNVKTKLFEYTVDLPKKHSKGGQSSIRFARLRIEKRQNYITKLSEHATRLFITNDKPNVTGIILAGSADFKTKLSSSETFDPRLKEVIINTIDIAYGGDAGFNQAVELSKELLGNVRYIEERKVLTDFFTNISRDTNKYVFGKKETLNCLKQGVIENLIVWEDLKDMYENADNNEDKNQESLVEWLVYNAKNYGTDVTVISSNTPEGTQFIKGFGGLGGILRYVIPIELEDIDESLNDEDDSFI